MVLPPTAPRVVFDTNVLVSALLLEASLPARALLYAEASGAVLYSDATLAELAAVLLRPKFARYITPEEVDGLLARILRSWEKTTIHHHIAVCCDPKDDMFLELAVGGAATTLISGDKDLLALGSYRGVVILTPAQFFAAVKT